MKIVSAFEYVVINSKTPNTVPLGGNQKWIILGGGYGIRVAGMGGFTVHRTKTGERVVARYWGGGGERYSRGGRGRRFF